MSILRRLEPIIPEPEELISHLQRGSNYCEYTPTQISLCLGKSAKNRDYESFGRVVEAYAAWNAGDAERLGRDHTEMLKQGVRCMAIAASGADHMLGFRVKQEDEGHVKETYLNPDTYGSTMRAFADHVGVEGRDLVQLIFDESSGRA